MPGASTGEGPRAVPPIEVELQPEAAPAFAAIVRVRGELDMATTPRLVEVLAPLKGNLLIDLSGCEFVDSSFVHVVVETHEELQRDGFRLEVAIPPEKKHLARVLEVTGATGVIAVRDSIEPST